MIRINQIKLPISYTKQDLIRACEKKLRRKNLPEVRILRRSLDSRKKDRIHYSVSAGVFGLGEPVERKICKIVNDNNVIELTQIKMQTVISKNIGTLKNNFESYFEEASLLGYNFIHFKTLQCLSSSENLYSYVLPSTGRSLSTTFE